MSVRVRRLPGLKSGSTLGFAAKVIGIGLFAGLMLTYCNALIDACFSREGPSGADLGQTAWAGTPPRAWPMTPTRWDPACSRM